MMQEGMSLPAAADTPACCSFSVGLLEKLNR